jgi:hypothetical protein
MIFDPGSSARLEAERGGQTWRTSLPPVRKLLFQCSCLETARRSANASIRGLARRSGLGSWRNDDCCRRSAVAHLGVVPPCKNRSLGFRLVAGFLHDRWNGRVGHETRPALSSQSKTTIHDRFLSDRENTSAPLDPCWRRFSAPAVVKTCMKWSKSSTHVVASNIVGSVWWRLS